MSPKFFMMSPLFTKSTVSFEIQGNLLIAKFYKTKPRYLEESSTILKGKKRDISRVLSQNNNNNKMNSYTAKQQILTLPM